MSIDGGLRPLFRQNIKRAQWTTIESGGTASGIPDAYVCLSHGFPLWIEYKQTKGWTPKIRVFQKGWHLTHTRMGGVSFIAVRRTPAAPAGTDQLWLLAGGAVERLADSGLRGLSQGDVVGRWDGGPSKWNWDEVRRVLTGGSVRF